MTKPFMQTAPNGFQSFHDADELMQERRVYQNPAAKLIFKLFAKGILTARDVLEALGVEDLYDIDEETETYAWTKIGARTGEDGGIELYRERHPPRTETHADIFRDHPTPWRVEKINEHTANVVDANGRVLIPGDVEGFDTVYDSRVPGLVVDLVNACKDR